MTKKIWQKHDWEDQKTFEVFQYWLHMFEDRDVHEAYRRVIGQDYAHGTGEKIVAPLHIVRSMNGFYDEQIPWTERAEAWDLEQKRRDVSWWLEQRKRIRKNEYELARMIFARAKEMLEWPIYEDTEEEDEYGVRIIRKPVKWGIRDVSSLVKIGSEVARRAAEMEQSISKLVLALSPEAMRAVEILEEHGISYQDVQSNFETILIQAADKYEPNFSAN